MPSFSHQISDLRQVGPLVEVRILPPRDLTQVLASRGQPIPALVAALAIFDTGASSSVVRPDIIQRLGIQPIGQIRISTPSSSGFACYQYKAAIGLPNNVVNETAELIAAPLQDQPIQCLIGRDLLSLGVFTYVGYANTFMFSV